MMTNVAALFVKMWRLLRMVTNDVVAGIWLVTLPASLAMKIRLIVAAEKY